MHCGEYSTTCCAFKNAFVENKLNEEIDWGVNLRRDRKQEKDIILAEEPSELNVPKKKHHHKKKKSKKPKEIPLCQKLSEKITFNRDTATFKQYMDLLARPKVLPCPPAEPVGPKKIPKICSPRCAQLALPKKHRILYTWKDYFEILSPEQILWLKDLLSKKEALLPLDAYNYFKKLDKQKRKQKKLKRKKEKQKKIEKPKKTKVIKEINCLAKCIVHFFANKLLQTVKCSHIMITNIMKEKLEENNLIPPGYKRDNEKDICGRTLYETLDQLSVWLESNISYEDEDSEAEEGSRESSVSSITYSDLDVEESEETIPKEILPEEEMELEEEAEEEEQEYYVPIPEEYPVAEEAAESIVEEESVISLVEEKVEEEQVEEEEALSLAPVVGLPSYIEEEEEAEEMEDEATRRLLELAIHLELSETAVAEHWELAEPEEEEQKIPSELEITIYEKVPSEGALTDVAYILNELILRATPSEEERGLKIEEHSPDTMCCVTMKTWATWLVDVAQNTHNWCQWIQEVIAKVRFFAAVLKGEVKTPEGKTRILYREEWTQFTEMLAKDIEAWQKYNKHVKELSDKIIEGFQNKRVICCSACLKSKLIISAETAHQVTEQLVEALNTTGYWRGWLDAIVAEAKKLAALDFQLASIKDQDVSSTSGSGSFESSLIFEIIELKSPSTKTSSDTSVFFLEEVEGKDKDNENENKDC